MSQNLRIFCPLLGTVHYWGLLLNKNCREAGFCPLLGAFPVLRGALLGALAVFAIKRFKHSPRIKVTLLSDRKFDIYIGRI